MKNTILKSITFLMFISWLISIMFINNASFLPVVVFIISGTWLIAFGIANGVIEL